MTNKTITIDMEAYCRLKHAQQDDESFSQTIKRFVPDAVSAEELISIFSQVGAELSEGFYQGVEAALGARKTDADGERINGLLGHNGLTRSGRPRGKTKATGRRNKAQAA